MRRTQDLVYMYKKEKARMVLLYEHCFSFVPGTVLFFATPYRLGCYLPPRPVGGLGRRPPLHGPEPAELTRPFAQLACSDALLPFGLPGVWASQRPGGVPLGAAALLFKRGGKAILLLKVGDRACCGTN